MNEELTGLLERWPLAGMFAIVASSNVIFVGSYKGIGMELIDELYHPKAIIGFEPQQWACQDASDRLLGRPNCWLFTFGLGVESGRFPMGEWHTDACSFINTGPGSREQGFGILEDADEALKTLRLSYIDLMIINIEGYEFKLLPYLIEKGWMNKIDRLAVQWHVGLGDDPKGYDDIADIIDKIEKTGKKLVYDERPAWTYFLPSWIGGDV